MTNVKPLPWTHATLADLAKALGVTARSVELWRKADAPLPAAGEPGGFDELAVRLWHAAGPGLTGGKRAAALLPPAAGTALAGYLARVDALKEALDDGPATSAGDALKREQTIAARLKNAERKRQFLVKAREHFDRLLGRFLSQVEREAVPLASEVHTACAGKDRHQAEPVLRRLLRSAAERAATAALRGEG